MTSYGQKKLIRTKVIMDNNQERRIRLSWTPEDCIIMASTGQSFAHHPGSFKKLYKFMVKSEKQGWYIFYNIDSISECKKFAGQF